MVFENNTAQFIQDKWTTRSAGTYYWATETSGCHRPGPACARSALCESRHLRSPQNCQGEECVQRVKVIVVTASAHERRHLPWDLCSVPSSVPSSLFLPWRFLLSGMCLFTSASLPHTCQTPAVPRRAGREPASIQRAVQGTCLPVLLYRTPSTNPEVVTSAPQKGSSRLRGILPVLREAVPNPCGPAGMPPPYVLRAFLSGPLHGVPLPPSSRSYRAPRGAWQTTSTPLNKGASYESNQLSCRKSPS